MKKPGKLLVTFRPGVITGCYNEGEEKLKAIAVTLGGLTEKVFDMYMEFSNLADEEILVREERVYGRRDINVSFYYPLALSVQNVRQVIINKLLREYMSSSNYPRPGIYVVQNKRKNLSLIYKPQGRVLCRV